MRVGLGGITGTGILSVGLGVSVGGGGVQPTPCEPVDQIDGNVAQGATFTHPADGVVAFTATVPSSGNSNISYRRQSALDHWFSQVTPAGAVTLVEKVSSANTNRGTAFGVVNGSRIVIVLNGPVIEIFVDGESAILYESATNFQSEADGEIVNIGTGGAIADLKTWTLACRSQEGV